MRIIAFFARGHRGRWPAAMARGQAGDRYARTYRVRDAAALLYSVVLIRRPVLRHSRIMRCIIPIVLLAVAASAAEPLDPSVKPMRAVIDRYAEDLEALERRYSLRDAESRNERLARYHQEQLDKLRQLKFSDLDVEGRID